MIVVSTNIPNTNTMRLGLVGLMGRAAPFTTVKAGVHSCSFALAA